MASSKYVQCLLWDFGNTLCDELSLWRVSPEWMEVYRSFDDEDGIGAAWSLGDLDTHEVVAKLAQRMPVVCANEQALLIDNKQSNLDAWAGRGGAGYLYTTDAAFRQDVAGGIDDLSRR